MFELDQYHVGLSDTTIDTNLDSPAISISSMPDGRRTSTSGSLAPASTTTAHNSGPVAKRGTGFQATNHPINTATARDHTTLLHPYAQPADAANLSPDTRPVFLPDDLEYPTISVCDTDPQHHLAASSTDAAPASSYTLGVPSFGSQPWVAPSGPFLDFAPQPIYEPTGELLHENVHTFDHFDVPSLSSLPATVSTTPRNPPHPPPTHLAEVATAANGTGVATAFVPPLLPRSALKRKPSSTASTPTESSLDKRVRSIPNPGPDTTITLNRSVTFERMSGVGPTSPDEGSTTSELPTGSRAAPGGNRRTRQSSSSTPRPSVLASTSSQGSLRGRGTRVSSGHPPSILPPEKVFPIQIGSDLFRLSGASISSDGRCEGSGTCFRGTLTLTTAPSYFTQFFEEQIRQNEESGGVRTLYIDRDPATFRDVARHLQGSVISWLRGHVLTACIGYYVKPVDGSHFVKLFADAQFYSCT